MPDTAKVSADFDAGAGKSVQVDDATIESMAAKSGESVESIKQKLGLAEKESNTDGQATSGDTLLAGKFRSEEALNDGLRNITEKLEIGNDAAKKIIDALGPEKAYKHFEQELGNKSKATKEDTTKDALSDDEETTKDALSDDNEADKTEGEKPAELNWETLTKEFMENGDLSKESREAITKVIPENYLNQYLQGISATEELMSYKVHDAVGGEENYDTIIEWAKTGLDAKTKAKFNDTLNSGNIAAAVSVAEALMARYEKANGSLSRTRLDGSSTNAAAEGGYRSIEEMQRDMRDPRYRSGDKNFHAMVARRMKFAKF